MMKSAYVAGGVGGVALLAKLVDQQVSSIPARYPFIDLGLAAAGIPSESLAWYKTVHYDDINRVGYATLTSQGRKIRICAKQIGGTQVPVVDAHYDDDLEAEGSGLAFYWENPWEVKSSILRAFSNLKKRFHESDDDNPRVWELTFLSIDNDQLIGDNILDHPDFASEFYSKKSHEIRAKIVLGTLFFSAFFLLTKRAYTTWRMWPSYSFAQSFVLNHSSVKQFYRDTPSVQVISRTGVFEPKKINAELILSAGNVESVVTMEASKTGKNWIVTHALLTPQGCKGIDLLVKT